jgi:hypothetical protein
LVALETGFQHLLVCPASFLRLPHRQLPADGNFTALFYCFEYVRIDTDEHFFN